jgi:transposase
MEGPLTGVGIDVGKHTLAVAIHGFDWTGEFQNTTAGRKKLVQALTRRVSHGRVVLEPTATYHLAIATALAEHDGYQVMIANPRLTASFAKALNQRGKSDAADSTMLAQYAATMPFKPWSPPSEAAQGLRALMRRRGQLVRQRTAEKTRLKEARATQGDPLVSEDIQATIDFLKGRIQRIEARALELVRQDAPLEAWRAQLCTIPGVADVTALTLIAEMVCLPTNIKSKQLTAMAGLDPQLHQSGTMDAKRHISKKGNRRLRTALYLAAWNAAAHSPHVGAYKDKLLERGKAPNVAYVATARRLLLAIHGMRRAQTAWDGERFHATAI